MKTIAIIIFLLLIPFTVEAIQLTWTPPTTYEDGSAIMAGDIKGYKLYCGTSSRNYGTPIDVGNVTSYAVTAGGVRYCAVTAYDSWSESNYSNEVIISSKLNAPYLKLSGGDIPVTTK